MLSLTSGYMPVVAGVVLVNTLVWLLWKVLAFRHTMDIYFTHGAGHPPLSLLLSTVSHHRLLHLAASNYTLVSFAIWTGEMFTCSEFLLVYLSGGVVSASSSVVYRKLLGCHDVSFCGASGALRVLAGYVCGVTPMKVKVVHVPYLGCPWWPCSFTACFIATSVSIIDAIAMALDCCYMDHAGHIGGNSFGFLLGRYGRGLLLADPPGGTHSD